MHLLSWEAVVHHPALLSDVRLWRPCLLEAAALLLFVAAALLASVAACLLLGLLMADLHWVVAATM